MSTPLTRERVQHEDFSHEDVIALFEENAALLTQLATAQETVKMLKKDTVDIIRQRDALQREAALWRTQFNHAAKYTDSLVIERDALAARVRELEGALTNETIDNIGRHLNARCENNY